MRAARIEVRGFRNLADLDLALPEAGAVFLGPNGHGKTNLLEALYYPVLFRSFRGAGDADLVRWEHTGFFVALVGSADDEAEPREFTAGYLTAGRRKRIALDGVETERLGPAIGQWLAVAFLPTDLLLVQGPASGRRQYLDRVLSLAEPDYLGALSRYRAALAQRNAALRLGREDAARPFDRPLARYGSVLVTARLRWIEQAREQFGAEAEQLGEQAPVSLGYRGRPELADRAAWEPALEESRHRDLARRATMTGPHRDDLVLHLGEKPLREYGSRGQHRTAAIALKLCELRTLGEARQTRPALLLDDIFAELDRDRQERLAARLGAPGVHQVFITAPRRDELPPRLDLEPFDVAQGKVTVRDSVQHTAGETSR